MTTHNAMGKTTATTAGNELTVTRTFHASRKLVYKAWTDPKHLPMWWGPQSFTITTHELDIRPGGVWHYVMHGPDGQDYDNKMTFLEMNAPEQISYVHGDSIEEEQFRVNVTFEEQGQATLLTMRMQFKSAEILEQAVKEYGALEGAASTLSRLEDQLPAITFAQALGHTFKLERIFDAPRELVFKAFSEAEHLQKWWGPQGWTLTVCNLDFKPGGAWHYCMKCIDKNQGDFYGYESWGKAIYEEIIGGEKIVYTDYFSDSEGNESQDLPPSTTTLTFEEYEGKTRVVSVSQYRSAEALKTVVDMGMEQGITETWDRLAQHLQAVQ